MKTLKLILIALIAVPAFAANYKYNELLTKDYDEMQKMVQMFAAKARQATTAEEESDALDEEAVGYYQEAMKLMFSRPNSDNMIAKLMPEVRRDLVGFSAFEKSIGKIADEAIRNVKGDTTISIQATSLVILENILAEIRPEAEMDNKMLREIIGRIRDANLKISEDVKKDRRMRGMFKTKNPSEEAGEIMKKIEKAEKAKKKK